MKSTRFIFTAAMVLSCALLAACQGAQVPGAVSLSGSRYVTVTYTPFQAVSSTPRPTATQTPTITPTSTPLPCTDEAGKIEVKEEQFSTSRQPLHFRVYTPACFGENPRRRYPVLYMIHGQTYFDDQWERLGIGEAADELIKAKKAPPFIIVMPGEQDTFEDIYAASFSKDVIDELIPWIDANYPTCAVRACRAIGGLSRGGAWALHLGFRNWQLFGSVGLHSTPPFNTDPTYFPIWLRDIPTDQRPRVYMDAGKGDVWLPYASAFEALLTRLDVQHEWHLQDGRHEEAYWSAHVKDYLAWYSQPWNDMRESLRIP